MISIRRITLGVLWGIVGMLLLATAISANAQTAPPVIPPSSPANNPNINQAYTEVATYFIETGKPHKVCFTQPNLNADGTPQRQWLRLNRYRVEGGGYDTPLNIPFVEWFDSLSSTSPNDFCVNVTPFKKAGHWVYEAALCNTEALVETSCSIWVSALIPSDTTGGAGDVDARAKGWWVYAYLPRPGGVGVD